MKKIIILFAIALTTNIIGMKRKCSISQELLPEISQYILIDLAQNVHNYVHKNNPAKASRIIVNISLINKYWCELLEKKRNDPLTTRNIIYNLKKVCHPLLSETFILCNFKTPGSKKCMDLSQKLYDYSQNEAVIESLVNEGALLNYHHIQEAVYVVQCAALTIDNNSTPYLKKLLALGADPNVKTKNEPTALGIAIDQQNIDKVTAILEYKPYDKCWQTAFDAANPTILYRIMDYSTATDLTEGLIVCIENGYHPEIMNRFIKKGASIEQTLTQLLKEKYDTLVFYDTRPLNQDELFTESIAYLLQHKKIDPEFSEQFKEKQCAYERCKKEREKNEKYYSKNRNLVEKILEDCKKYL